MADTAPAPSSLKRKYFKIFRGKYFNLPGCGDVVGVSTAAEARQSAVDLGSSLSRVLLALQDEDPRPLAHHEPVPVRVEGSRGLARTGVILGGESPAVIMRFERGERLTSLG